MLPSIFGENLFDEWFDGSLEKQFFGGRDPLYGKHAKNLMKTDVKELDHGYLLDVELPGFKKDEIEIQLQDGYLTISANKQIEKEEKKEKGRYIRQERYGGQCSRSFYVGDIRPEDIQAKYEDGVLRVQIPREEESKLQKQSRISIE
ncbi:MAG: Hsp20/alpha crystallin family protein [Christensenellaceae bacterium]